MKRESVHPTLSHGDEHRNELPRRGHRRAHDAVEVRNGEEDGGLAQGAAEAKLRHLRHEPRLAAAEAPAVLEL